MFQDTGTVHLMVISGSHISLLAGMLYGLVAALHRLGCWPRRLPWLPCACALGLLGAWSYGLMAGFEVPVRRACLMVSLALVWRLRFRHLGLLAPLLGTLVLVLLVEPLASLQAGFWLSFLAVALLLWLFAGRLGRWRWWAAWGRAQWGMALGLAMPLLALGLPLSLSGALANLLAVPWIELLVVPPALAGSLLLWVPGLGEGLLRAAGVSLDLLFRALGLLAGLAEAWQPPAAAAWSVALGMLGALCWLAPAGLPLRALGAALLLPALLPSSPPVEWGRAEVRVLDVGQGLAVLVRTREHALLYDSGARQGAFDMGERVVVPVLRSLDLRRLDGLLLSHADNDHAGGAPTVASPIPAGLAGQRRTRAPAFAVVRGQLRRAELVLGWRGFRTVGMGAGRRQQRPLLCAEGRGRWRSPAADRGHLACGRACLAGATGRSPGRLVAGAASWQPQFLRSRLRVAYATSPCAGLARLAQRLRPSPWRSDGALREGRRAGPRHGTRRCPDVSPRKPWRRTPGA